MTLLEYEFLSGCTDNKNGANSPSHSRVSLLRAVVIIYKSLGGSFIGTY